MMDRREKFFGRTLAQYLEQLPGQIENDLVYAWQVFGAGRQDFGFSGAELERFVRLSLDVLLEHGAVPYRAEPRPHGGWTKVPVPGLGSAREDVIDSIVRAWREQTGTTDELDGLAFATQGYIDEENRAG